MQTSPIRRRRAARVVDTASESVPETDADSQHRSTTSGRLIVPPERYRWLLTGKKRFWDIELECSNL